MAKQHFEREIGRSLRLTTHLWVYRPPDDTRARAWRPGDFIVGSPTGWAVLECKEVASGDTFPLSRWTPQQRLSCRAVTDADGQYFLVIRFAQPSVPTQGPIMVPGHHYLDEARGSIPFDSWPSMERIRAADGTLIYHFPDL